MLIRINPPVLFAFSLMFAFPATAEIFCVTNSSELQSALDTAESNSEADEIRLKSGTFNNGSAGFIYSTNQNHDITISGGWTNVGNLPCLLQLASPYVSVFDGDGTGPNLKIDMEGGRLEINNLSFINGGGVQPNRGVGLTVDALSSQLTEVLIERNVFINNDTTFCSALCLITTAETTLRNNVFADNQVASASGVVNVINYAGGTYFINNTLVDNITTSTSLEATAGLELFARDGSPALLANNIFWNNVNADLKVRDQAATPSDLYLYSNNYLVALGDFDVSSGNLSVDPQLEGAAIFNFTPSLTSPMRNAGRPMEHPLLPQTFENTWDHGSLDLISTQRIKDNRVDIGAREADAEPAIFANGFD